MNTHELPGFLAPMAPLLNRYGYLAVGGLILLEDFGLPVPGESILVAAAADAGTGGLNVWLVGLVGFLAAVTGDNLGFVFGHYFGRRFVQRYGRFVFLTPDRLSKSEQWFVRYGGRIVVISRFVEGLRQANGIIAGITGLAWHRFLAFNALGALLWILLWVSLGYLAGEHSAALFETVHRYKLYLLGAAAVLGIALAVRHLLRFRRKSLVK